jgi:hypothetical protein
MKILFYWSLLACPLLASAQVSAPRGVLGAGGGSATAGVYRLTDTAGQFSVGAASSATYAVAEGFWPSPGNAPVATTLNLGTKIGQTIALSLTKLLLLSSDPNGEILYVATVSGTSANGGTVTLNAGVINYTPASGFTGSDTFSYVLADAGGNTASGTITVAITSQGISFNQMSITPLGGGDLQISFLGVPGTNYAMEVTHDLTPPVTWVPLVTNVAAANGLLVFTNMPGSTNSYYRTLYLP